MGLHCSLRATRHLTGRIPVAIMQPVWLSAPEAASPALPALSCFLTTVSTVTESLGMTGQGTLGMSPGSAPACLCPGVPTGPQPPGRWLRCWACCSRGSQVSAQSPQVPRGFRVEQTGRGPAQEWKHSRVLVVGFQKPTICGSISATGPGNRMLMEETIRSSMSPR